MHQNIFVTSSIDNILRSKMNCFQYRIYLTEGYPLMTSHGEEKNEAHTHNKGPRAEQEVFSLRPEMSFGFRAGI